MRCIWERIRLTIRPVRSSSVLVKLIGKVCDSRPDPAVYSVVVQRDSVPYLARMTPYACVTAEMLGAHFEILATYKSNATGSTTYHSYFVVNRTSFPNRPTLDAV